MKSKKLEIPKARCGFSTVVVGSGAGSCGDGGERIASCSARRSSRTLRLGVGYIIGDRGWVVYLDGVIF